MEIKLSRKWVSKMKKLPESGMGYQRVKVKLKEGVILYGIVTNCDTLQVTDSIVFGNKNIENISLL